MSSLHGLSLCKENPNVNVLEHCKQNELSWVSYLVLKGRTRTATFTLQKYKTAIKFLTSLTKELKSRQRFTYDSAMAGVWKIQLISFLWDPSYDGFHVWHRTSRGFRWTTQVLPPPGKSEVWCTVATKEEGGLELDFFGTGVGRVSKGSHRKYGGFRFSARIAIYNMNKNTSIGKLGFKTRDGRVDTWKWFYFAL